MGNHTNDNDLKITDYNFLPSFDLRLSTTHDEANDAVAFLKHTDFVGGPLDRIDASMLDDYITTKLKVRTVKNGLQSIYESKFRKCTTNDFR